MLISLPPTTLAWMAAMIAQDENESFDNDVALVEYLASFLNAEGVQEAKRMRKGADRVKSDDAGFLRALENISGRPAPEFQE